jgi:hypothetical protein
MGGLQWPQKYRSLPLLPRTFPQCQLYACKFIELHRQIWNERAREARGGGMERNERAPPPPRA